MLMYEGIMIIMRRLNLNMCWGEEQNTGGGKSGIFEKNEKICVGRKKFFTPFASVGSLSIVIFGGNETGCYFVTEVTETG